MYLMRKTSHFPVKIFPRTVAYTDPLFKDEALTAARSAP
jgi:hypothetical protein